MKEKLLADWQHQYERICWELKDNEKKLESVNRRQRNLEQDIRYQILFAVICIFIIYILLLGGDSVGGWAYGFGFYPIYMMVIGGLVIVFVVYHGYLFVKRVRRYFYHTRELGPVEYPGPEIVASNYSLHIPPNYYAERQCIMWLIQQYTEDIERLLALQQKINHASEQDLDHLREELESIVIYERVGVARQ